MRYCQANSAPLMGRRDFGKLLLGGLAIVGTSPWAQGQAAPVPGEYSVISGIPFGVESFSFHDLPRGVPDIIIPKLIEYMKAVGLTEIEPLATHLEPFGDNPSMRNYHP